MKNTRIILALLFISSIVIGGLIWHTSQLQRGLIHSTALKTAKLYSVALTQFRNIYTLEIVTKAQSMGIDIAHDYASRKDAIPLPAALTMRMAEEIGKHTSGAKAQLYSPYPFPLKKERNETLYINFSNKAWDFLVKNPDQAYSRFDVTGTGSMLQYATADIMQEQCVACHNNHPDSPKKDWKTGDVGGVLIVNLPLDDIIIQTEENLKSISIVYLFIGFGIVLIIGIVIVRLRQQAQKSQRDHDFSQGLLNTAPVIVLLLDTHGYIQYVNPYFEKICGYKLDEIKGKEWISTFLPEHDQDRVRHLLRSAERGEQVDGNINPIVCRNGKEHQIEWYARTMRDDTGEIMGVLSIGRDITEHKIADDKLRETSQLLDNIIENVPDTIFLKRASDLRYEYFNRAGEKLLGLDRAELIGHNDYELFSKKEAELFVKKDREVLQQHGVVDIPEEFLKTSNGTRTLHTKKITLRDEQGNPQFLLGISEDITDRLNIEKSLIQKEERLNAAQRLAKVGSWDLDLLTNHLVWSDEIYRIFEIDKEKFDFSYDAFLKAIYPEDRELVEKAYADSLVSREPYEITHRLMMSDGRIKFVIETCETFFDDKGKPTRSMGTVQDITERSQKEEALILSEQRLTESQKIAHLGHWNWNIINGDIYWSDEHYRICGVEPGQVIPTYEVFLDFIHPDDRKDWKSAITTAMTANNYDFKHRLRHPDGEVRYVHGIGQVHYDNDGKPLSMIGTIQDITEQIKAEQQLEKSKSQFEAMFESIPDAVVFADLDRKIRMVNTATIQMFGYDESELIGNQTVMIYASTDVYMDQGKKRFNMNTDTINAPYEVMYLRKDGQEFVGETLGTPVTSPNGKVLGFLGIIRDVTNKNQVNSILKSLAAGASSLNFESFMNELLERLTETYNCPYAFIGQLQKDGQHVKTLAVRIKGKPADNFEYSLKGTPCHDILYTNKRLISTGVKSLYRNDKMLIDMGIDSYFGARLVSLDGTVLGFLSVMDTKPLKLDEWTEPVLEVFATRMSLELERDIASKELLLHREHLEELVHKRTALIKVARDESVKANQAKSEFLTRMSHELRTPMNAILGFGQMLELDAEGFNETQQGNVKEILDASHHLMDLINEVLDLAKIESGKLEITMENVSVDDVLQQSIALVQPLAASRHIKLADHVNGNGYVFKADITRLKQVFVNLLANAIKYNHENGSVTLDSELIDKQRLRIRIMDTGKGLTEIEIAKLFKPFVRLDKVNNVEGTGIGLVITKHLVELMGGTIGVESTPGEGCTFWVEFELIKDV